MRRELNVSIYSIIFFLSFIFFCKRKKVTDSTIPFQSQRHESWKKCRPFKFLVSFFQVGFKVFSSFATEISADWHLLSCYAVFDVYLAAYTHNLAPINEQKFPLFTSTKRVVTNQSLWIYTHYLRIYTPENFLNN